VPVGSNAAAAPGTATPSAEPVATASDGSGGMSGVAIVILVGVVAAIAIGVIAARSRRRATDAAG
jgi:hypothetical protein